MIETDNKEDDMTTETTETTRRRPGRPLLPVELRMCAEDRVTLRLTRAERASLDDAALAHGWDRNNLIRRQLRAAGIIPLTGEEVAALAADPVVRERVHREMKAEAAAYVAMEMRKRARSHREA